MSAFQINFFVDKNGKTKISKKLDQLMQTRNHEKGKTVQEVNNIEQHEMGNLGSKNRKLCSIQEDVCVDSQQFKDECYEGNPL